MRFTTEHHKRLDDAAIAIDKGYPVDYNQGVWHMGLAMDDPDVAELVDEWGEVVSMGRGAPNDAERRWRKRNGLCVGCGHRPYWCRCRCG